MGKEIYLFEKKEYCYGCMACVAVCPQKAISIYTDEQGFYYPRIEREKCINCGLCKKVCQI